MKPRLALVPALCALALLVMATSGLSAADRKRPTPPKVTGIATSNDPRLSFSARDNVTPAKAVRYRCSKDGGKYLRCRSGARLALAPGEHTLRVVALDRAGNRSRPGAVRVNVTETPTFTRVATGGFEPGELVAGGGALWLGGSDGIHRIDPGTSAIRLQSPGEDLFPLSFGHGSVWTTTFEPGAVIRVDPTTGARTAVIDTAAPVGVAADATSVWVTGRRDGTISRIDPGTNTKTNSYVVGPEGPGGPGYVVAADDGLWVGASLTNPRLVRITPATGAVTITANTGMCSDLVVVGDVVVHTCSRTSAVALVARSTGSVRLVATSCGSGQPLVVGATVWVPCNGAGAPRLLRIDTASAKVVEEIVLSEVRAISEGTVAFDAAWLVVPGDAVLRLPLSALSR
jgi:streptogramin lyase